MDALADTNYWDVRPEGVAALLLVGLALFPRLTVLVLVLGQGFALGVWGWIGWLFAPHLLVAILGTEHYWHTNPVLCVIAWCFAFGGTGSEAGAVRRRWRRRRPDEGGA